MADDKSEKIEFPKWLYHRRHGGRIFNSYDETRWLWLKGWRDKPFPVHDSNVKSVMRVWWESWEWVFKAVGGLLVIIAALLKVFGLI